MHLLKTGIFILNLLSSHLIHSLSLLVYLHREKKTRNYLIVYTVFNTGAHVAAISAVYVLDPEFDGSEGIVDKV